MSDAATPSSKTGLTDLSQSGSSSGANSSASAGLSWLLQKTWKLLTSYGLAVVILVLLTLLTLLGTWEQKDHGLFDTQKKYFESIFVVHTFEMGALSVPIILPGAYILMMVLFFNLLAGALIKARKNLKAPGMLIAHSGILLLLVGGFVSHHYSTKGYMALYKGEESNQYQAYQGWQLEVMPLDEKDRPTEAFIITEEELLSVRGDRSRLFTSSQLPFDMRVSHYMRNARPIPTGAPMGSGVKLPEIDGYKLIQIDDEKEAERNVGGVYVEAELKGSAQADGSSESASVSKGIVWAGQAAPWIVEADGKKWAVRLDRERWDVPFTIRLDEFIFDRHPGTTMAKKYESRITRSEGEQKAAVQIRMNEPLRYRGYTFFQESFGPPDESDADKMFSQFSVVKNPADQWPLYSLIVTFAGMGIHFMQKLAGFISRSNRGRA
jgi:hypothetical protein